MKIALKAVKLNVKFFQKNLAKFKRGKHGSGLDDIDIEELDWVRHNLIKALGHNLIRDGILDE